MSTVESSVTMKIHQLNGMWETYPRSQQKTGDQQATELPNKQPQKLMCCPYYFTNPNFFGFASAMKATSP